MTSYQHCQVLTTAGSREAAGTLARSAVEARVAACAQVVGPVTSTYWWNDKIETTNEWQVVLKTTMDRYPALEEHIRSWHSYDVPEILCLPVVAGNPTYLEWLTQESRPG